MKRIISVFVIFAGLSACGTLAQGLKGNPDTGGCHRDYEMPKIKGANDAERWKNLAKLGPKLIGITKQKVEQELGKGHFDSKHERLQYAVTEGTSAGKGYDYTNLTLHLKNGKVARFEISSVDWQ